MLAEEEGALHAAVGESWLTEARISMLSLRALHPDLPVDVLTGDFPAAFDAAQCHAASRALKASVLDLSGFERSLRLDSDTEVHGPLEPFFEARRDGPGVADRVVTNGPRARHEARPSEERSEAVVVEALSDPETLNRGILPFSHRLRDTSFGRAWRVLWLAQIRAGGCGDWERLSDERAFNVAIRRCAPRLTASPNTIWNAQCENLAEVTARDAWNKTRIVHRKLEHAMAAIRTC